MATAYENSTDQSATSLVSGIVDDIQELVKQQLRLTRREIEAELRQAQQGAVMMASAAALLFIAAIVLCFAVAHLIHWATAPAGTDPASFPLWACYAAVGVVIAALGATLGCIARKMFKSISPLQNPATEALKDNVEWATNQR